MDRKKRTRDRLADLAETGKALTFAERRHAGQVRAVDGAPFIEHPVEVASLLYEAGAADQVIAAGVLHDVLEKTRTSAGVLRRHFGSHIAALVLAVSEDERILDFDARKAALRERAAAAGDEALAVFAADKISKVRELQLDPGRRDRSGRPAFPPDTPAHLEHYRRSLEMLEERLPRSPLVRRLRAEFKRLPHALTESSDRARGLMSV
jgi:(p)ppGpp synthase/HD superfamily hydrolase